MESKKILHGFDGSCRPAADGKPRFHGQVTFSVSVFPLLPKSNGKGTKRGKAVVRIVGLCSDPEAVYERARQVIDLLDKGLYIGPKNINVGI